MAINWEEKIVEGKKITESAIIFEFISKRFLIFTFSCKNRKLWILCFLNLKKKKKSSSFVFIFINILIYR